MKKLIAMLIAAAMVCVFTPMVGADEETIVVTLTPGGTADITVAPGTWDPSVSIGNELATTDGHFNITNVGNVQVNVNISASDTDYWTINTTADHDKFVLNYNFTLSGDWEELTTTPALFLSSFPSHEDNYYEFDLKVVMPTSSSTNDEQTSTITFTATAT